MSSTTADAGPGSAWAGPLRAAQLFRGLDDADVEVLLPAFTTRQLARGSALYRQGDEGPHDLYVLLSGRLSVVQAAGEVTTVLAVLGPSDMAGEVGALDPSPRTSSILALADSTVAALARDDLLDWVSSRPHVAERLLQVLARRLRRTNDVLAGMVFTDVPARVAAALLDLGERFGRPTQEGLRIEHGLSQSDLAQLVGASRETVNKALAGFVSRGWVRLEQRAVVLLDPAAVQRRAGLPSPRSGD